MRCKYLLSYRANRSRHYAAYTLYCVSRRQVPRVTFNVPIMIKKKIMKTLLHFYDDILLMLFHIGKTSTTSYVADLSKGRKVSFELIKQYT